MPTHITQVEDAERQRTVLRIDGDMELHDAVLLERIVEGLDTSEGRSVIIDIADLSFLDSEAASVLKKLGEKPGLNIDGMEIFLQAVVNHAERK
jgi:anti-anti-sigma factor